MFTNLLAARDNHDLASTVRSNQAQSVSPLCVLISCADVPSTCKVRLLYTSHLGLM